MSHLTRRHVLAAGAGITALPVLAACGDDGGDVPEPEAVAAGTTLVRADDVPVGGCAVVSEHRTVVTQPQEGEF